MNDMRVKVIIVDYIYQLEEEVNRWLEENEGKYEIVDIKFATRGYLSGYFAAMVIYK